MKAEGGALIYVVLAVISLIVSAIGKSKKKVGPPVTSKPASEEPAVPHKEPQTTWQKELEDIFGKVLTEPEVVVEKRQYEEPKPVIKPKIEPQVSVAEQRSVYMDAKKTISSEQKNAELSKSTHVDENEHEIAGINLEEFELNKAIIYSEVLHRKYF